MNLIYVVIFAMIIWGVSWASAKMITNYTNFEVILFWRLLVTFVSLVPVLWITKDSFRISKKAIPFVVCGDLDWRYSGIYSYVFSAVKYSND